MEQHHAARWLQWAYLCALLWGFALPVSVAAVNGLIVLCLCALFMAGTWSTYRSIVMGNPIAHIALALFALLGLGMGYSVADWEQAWDGWMHYTDILTVVLVMLVFNSQARQRAAVDVWLISMGVILGLTFFIVLSGIALWNGTPDNAYLFKNHITHSILMALTAYIAAVRGMVRKQWGYFALTLLAMLNVLIFTQGRSGQVVLLGLFLLFLYQFFPLRWMVAGLFALVVGIGGLYSLSHNFQHGVDKTIIALRHYQATQADNSTAVRYEYLRNAWGLYQEHPWLGTGTGSYAPRYLALVTEKDIFPGDNPHNEYLMLGIQLGLPGIMLFVAWLGAMMYYSRYLDKEARYLAQGVALMMAVGCLFNSLLLDFTEGHVFAYFTGVLFANLHQGRAGTPGDKSRAWYHPRNWLLWLGVDILWLLSFLPVCWQHKLGRQLGLQAMPWMTRRRNIAACNLALCFPTWSEQQRANLLREHFAALGIGVLEMGLAWWASNARLRRVSTVHGLHHLDAALAQKKGVILVSGHFSTLELAMRIFILHRPMYGVYRPHEHPVIDAQMRKNRSRHAQQAIPRHDVRAMVRCLRANHALWFAPDQDFTGKGHVFVDFFGIRAATNTATARLASMTGAAVIPFICRRLAGCAGYELILSPPLENFPGPDITLATERINQVLEQAVHHAPEQYFWIHRRFKSRPPKEFANHKDIRYEL